MNTDTNIRKAADWDADLPVYDVTIGGVLVGQVMRAWLRNGGTQWVHTYGLTGIGPKGRTKAGAVEHLLQVAAARGIAAR